MMIVFFSFLFHVAIHRDEEFLRIISSIRSKVRIILLERSKRNIRLKERIIFESVDDKILQCYRE